MNISFWKHFGLFALTLLSAGVLSAEETAASPEPMYTAPSQPDCSAKPRCIEYSHLIEVGGNYTHMKLTPSGIPRFSGNLGGAQFSYEYRKRSSVYEGVLCLWREGRVAQDGTVLYRDIFDLDTQARLGYNLSQCNVWDLIPFTGFGWRYLGEKLRGASPLNLNYNEVYIPVGLLIKYKANSVFSIGANGFWMPQVFPNVNFVPLDHARWITAYTFSNFQVELPLLFRFAGKKTLGIFELRPFFQYWQDGKTLAQGAAGTALDLPKNTYLIGGFQFNLAVRF